MAIARLRPAGALAGCLLAFGGATWLAPDLERRPSEVSDFEAEVRALDRDIDALAARTAGNAPPRDVIRLAQGLYRRGTLTGQSSDFDRLRGVLGGLGDDAGADSELLLLRATVDLRFHRLDAARASLARWPGLDGDLDAQMVTADIDVQHGRYEQAQRAYQRAVDARPTWPALARLAYLVARRGDAVRADRLYAEAEDDVTAKEMRTFAWLKLQRGQLAFARGRYDDAQAHYAIAESAYSGFWLTDEYMAELLAARGRFDEAIARYERAAARAPRPDLFQQIGDLYAFIGRFDDARPWHARALQGYRASIERGEVQFLHHLAGYYADVARDGGRAVELARRDAALRPHYATDDALAWALYVAGDIQDAARMCDRALASGIVDGHLYYHAATIKAAAGDATGAARWQKALETLNPRYRDFHVHR
jgi:tetratricopeptide (TPR) repeat protein